MATNNPEAISDPAVHVYLQMLQAEMHSNSTLCMNCKIACATALAAFSFFFKSTMELEHFLFLCFFILVFYALDLRIYRMKLKVLTHYNAFLEMVKANQSDNVKNGLFEIDIRLSELEDGIRKAVVEEWNGIKKGLSSHLFYIVLFIIAILYYAITPSTTQ